MSGDVLRAVTEQERWRYWLAHLAIHGRSTAAAILDLEAGRPVDPDEVASALAITAGDFGTARRLLDATVRRQEQVPA